jgi:hypothetical protein
MKRVTAAVVLGLLISGCGHPGGVRPIGAIERALIIGVDGLRPDLLLRAEAPRMRALLRSGSYTPRAETQRLPDTLP